MTLTISTTLVLSLVFCSLEAAAYAVGRLGYSKLYIDPDPLFVQLNKLVRARTIDRAYKLCNAADTPVSAAAKVVLRDPARADDAVEILQTAAATHRPTHPVWGLAVRLPALGILWFFAATPWQQAFALGTYLFGVVLYGLTASMARDIHRGFLASIPKIRDLAVPLTQR